jgi:hypothetical protein
VCVYVCMCVEGKEFGCRIFADAQIGRVGVHVRGTKEQEGRERGSLKTGRLRRWSGGRRLRRGRGVVGGSLSVVVYDHQSYYDIPPRTREGELIFELWFCCHFRA